MVHDFNHVFLSRKQITQVKSTISNHLYDSALARACVKVPNLVTLAPIEFNFWSKTATDGPKMSANTCTY